MEETKKSKKGLIIGIIVAVAVIAAGASVFAFRSSRGLTGGSVSTFDAMKNSAKAMLSRTKPGKFLVDAHEDGKPASMTVDIDDLSLFSPSLSSLPFDIEVTFTLDGSKKLGCDINLDLFGMLDFSGSFGTTDKELYVDSPSLAEDSYKLTYATAAEDFKNSIFAPGSDSAYSITDEDSFNQTVEILSALSEKMSSGESFNIDSLQATLKENGLKCEFEEAKKDAEVGGENISVSARTLTLESEDIKAYGEYLEKVFSEDTLLSNSTVSTSFGDIDEITDALKNFDGTVTIEFDVYGSNLVKGNFSVVRGEKTSTASFDLGKDPATTSKMTISSEAGDSKYDVVYDIKDTDSVYEVDATVNSSDNESYSMTYTYDKSSDEFTINTPTSTDGSNSTALSGKCTYEGSKMTMAFTEMETTYNGETETATSDGVKVVFDANAKTPSAPEDAEEFFKLSEADLNSLIDELTSSKFIQTLALAYINA